MVVANVDHDKGSLSSKKESQHLEAFLTAL